MDTSFFQILVISGLIEGIQFSSPSYFANATEEPTSIEDDVGELEHTVKKAREISSRFNHKCELCTPHSRSKSQSLIEKQLAFFNLNNTESSSESDLSDFINEAEAEASAGWRLRELCRSNTDDKELVSDLLSRTSLQTSSSQTPVSLKPLQTASSRSFNRAPPFTRLHPLKL